MAETFGELDKIRSNVHFDQVIRFFDERVTDPLGALQLYRQVLRADGVPDATAPTHIQLRLSGLVKRDDRGNLVPRNRIYRKVFDEKWIRRARPSQTVRQLKLVLIAASILLLVTAGSFGYYAWQVAPAQALVDSLLTANPAAVPELIGQLPDRARWALPRLEKAFTDEAVGNQQETQQLHAAFGLAALGRTEEAVFRCLVEGIADSPPTEFGNFVTALAQSTPLALGLLREQAKSAESTKDWRQKSRLAIVALDLKDPSLCQEMLRLRPDPIERTMLVDTFPSWHGSVEQLATDLRSVEDGEFRSGLAMAIGSIAKDELTLAEKQAWQGVFDDWYRTAPDAATHSASGWALRNWSLPLPDVPVSAEPPADRDWWHTPSGLTLVRIPAGEFVRRDDDGQGDPQTVRISRDFWLSDREVSVDLFLQFVNDPDCPRRRKA